MKLYVYLLLFSFVGHMSYAQNSRKDKNFVNDIINRKNVFYQDSVGSTPTNIMHDILTRNKKPAFYTYRTDSILYTDLAGNKKIVLRQPIGLSADKDNSRYTNIKKDSLVLSDKEVSYVLSELEKMRNYKWSDGLLPDSKVIPIDTITKIYNAFREKAWGHFNEIGIYGILTISKPVFLRNDTICLFYFSENCGPDCAGGHFTVYKKVNSYWAQWIELYGWVV